MNAAKVEKPKTMPSTAAARAVVQNAIREAKQFKHDCVGAEHLLLALVEMPDSLIAKALVEAGVTSDLVRREMQELPPAPYEWGNLPFTPRARRILEQAEMIARKLGSPQVGEAHVLLALVQESEGRPAEWFTVFGARVDILKERAFAEITGCK